MTTSWKPEIREHRITINFTQDVYQWVLSRAKQDKRSISDWLVVQIEEMKEKNGNP